MSPELSICIPAYNYAQYLPAAIDSCLHEGLPVEIVVLDNASSDGTADLKQRYAGLVSVNWVANSQVLPVQQNWNRAVGLATSPWVKLLQADDRLTPGAVTRLLEIVRGSNNQHFHAHLSEVIDAAGAVRRQPRPYRLDRLPMVLQRGEGLPLKLRQSARLKEPTSNLYRKSAWEALGGYAETRRFTFDIDFNVRLMSLYVGTLWSETLAQVRRHANSDGARLPAALALSELSTLVEDILRRIGQPTVADHRAAQAWLQFRAIELAAQRIRRDPRGSLAFLVDNAKLLAKVDSWPSTLRLASRRLVHGDVQAVS